MRWLFQGAMTTWLLWLAFWALAVRFNRYGDTNIIDCDTDAEVAFMLLLIFLWLTTLAIWATNLALRYWSKRKPFWFLGGLSIFFSVAFIPKLIELMKYNAELSMTCP